MKTEFKILNIEEEQKLNRKELKEYYINLRNYLAERKLTNTSFGATTIAPRLNNINEYLSKLGIKMLNGERVYIACDGLEDIPTERVLFVHTSKNMLDSLITNIINDRHCISINDKEENELLLLCQLTNGLISIDKNDETNKNNAKLDAIRLLLEGKSISYFIKGDKKDYDFLEIAQKAGVAIIPVVYECKYNTSYANDTIKEIHSLYGSPIYVEEYDNIYKKIKEYENIIFTMNQELLKSTNLKRKKVLSN